MNIISFDASIFIEFVYDILSLTYLILNDHKGSLTSFLHYYIWAEIWIN